MDSGGRPYVSVSLWSIRLFSRAVMNRKEGKARPTPDGPMAQLPLETERLLLRAYRRADAAAIVRLLDDPAMAELLMVIPQPFVAFDALTLIRAAWRRLATGRGFDLAVTLRDGGDAPIGSVGIALHDGGRRGELGFWIGRDWWGNGYATEAASRMIGFTAAALRVERLTATAAADNAASVHVLEKLGFMETGRGTREVPATGEQRETRLFARASAE